MYGHWFPLPPDKDEVYNDADEEDEEVDGDEHRGHVDRKHHQKAADHKKRDRVDEIHLRVESQHFSTGFSDLVVYLGLVNFALDVPLSCLDARMGMNLLIGLGQHTVFIDHSPPIIVIC